MPRRATRKKESADQQQTSSRGFWTGTITFGLVSIPVELLPANRSTHVGLRMLSEDGRPLRRRYYSQKTGRELEDDDLVKGYEIRKGKYVSVTDEEFERLAPEKSRDIALQRFVDVAEIPPLYFEHAFFLLPASQSVRAYHLLVNAMEKTGQAGIATFVMRGKEYLVGIIAEKGVLRAAILRFQDEVRSPKDIGLPKRQEPAAASVRRFERMIQNKSRKSLPRDLMHDEQAVQLEQYARRKASRHKDVIKGKAAAEEGAEAVDIMSVLKKSLERAA